MGYELVGTDTPFFDTVILFAANIRDRDCAAEKANGETSHNCYKNGVHLHFNGNVQHILDNRDTYVKPLQDKGIKVLLGLLGDWGGVTFGTLGDWPLEARNSSNEVDQSLADNAELNVNTTSGGGYNNRNGYNKARWTDGYPYGPAARDAFLQEVAAAVTQYGLDGIDLDDEWGAKDIYAGGYVYPKTSGFLWYDGSSKNVYRYYAATTNKVNAALNDGAQVYARVAIRAREILGWDKIITMYEWNYGRPNANPNNLIQYNGGTVNLSDYVNFTGQASYGTYRPQGSYYGVPSAKHSPMAVDLGGPDNIRTRPAITGGAPAAVTNSNSYVNTDAGTQWGAILFYALLPRGRYSNTYTTNLKGDNLDSKKQFFDTTNGASSGNMPEVGLSKYSNVIFGKNVDYTGSDYTQDWVKF
jgi:hypothetical protein